MMNAVQMAAKLYECRDAARTLLGAHYKQDMDMWAEIIRADAKAANSSELKAALKLSSDGDGFKQMVVLAAFVEMTEPSANAQVPPPSAEGAKVGLQPLVGRQRTEDEA